MIPLGSMQIVESAAMTVSVEDWSRVRSPSRARRRMKRGHRQNVRVVSVPRNDCVMYGSTILMHPTTAREFRRQMELVK